MSELFNIRWTAPADAELRYPLLDLQHGLSRLDEPKLRFRMSLSDDVEARCESLVSFMTGESACGVEIEVNPGGLRVLLSHWAPPSDYELAAELVNRIQKLRPCELNSTAALLSLRDTAFLEMATRQTEAVLSACARGIADGSHKERVLVALNRPYHLGRLMLNQFEQPGVSRAEGFWQRLTDLQWLALDDTCRLPITQPNAAAGEIYSHIVVPFDSQAQLRVPTAVDVVSCEFGNDRYQLRPTQLLECLPDSARLLAEDCLLIPVLEVADRDALSWRMAELHHDYLAEQGKEVARRRESDARKELKRAATELRSRAELVQIWQTENALGYNCVVIDNDQIVMGRSSAASSAVLRDRMSCGLPLDSSLEHARQFPVDELTSASYDEEFECLTFMSQKGRSIGISVDEREAVEPMLQLLMSGANGTMKQQWQRVETVRENPRRMVPTLAILAVGGIVGALLTTFIDAPVNGVAATEGLLVNLGTLAAAGVTRARGLTQGTRITTVSRIPADTTE